MGNAKPLDVRWDEKDVERLFERVRDYEFPVGPVGSGWKYGCDLAYLRDLCAYWTTSYDWRKAIASLGAHPHFTARVDGYDVHFVHVVGEAEGKRPLILTHGWPSSVLEYLHVAEELAFPTRFGGRAEDAFDVVLPSLPGFGWSQRITGLVDQNRTAAYFNALMTDVLGYDRYLAAGGDWGAMVTARLALNHAPHVRGILSTMLFPQPADEPSTEAEKQWSARARDVEQRFGAYAKLQGGKPQSLAYAASGNPVGQLAWIVERFHDWADLRDRPFEAVFTREHLLTNAMISIMTETFETSLWYYAAAIESGTRRFKPGERVTVPTAFTLYPDPRHPVEPRSLAEKGYNVVRWALPERGGHFPALEVPEYWLADVRDWARNSSP